MNTPRQGITRFGLSNFKAFHYLDDIDLRPLTVLVGPNNCGKSSILQSLALLSQTLTSGPIDLPLLFDGNLVKLQSFETIVSTFNVERPVGFRFLLEDTIPTVLVLAAFPKHKISIDTEKAIRSQVEIKLSFKFVDGKFQPDILIRSWLPEHFGPEDALVLNSRAYGNLENYGPIYIQFLSQERGKIELVSLAIDLIEVVGFNFERFLPSGINIKFTDKQNYTRTAIVNLTSFMAFDISMKLLKDVLAKSLEYLGPVRADPKPFYPIDENPALGTRGEGAIPYLLRHQQDPIEYFPSPSEAARQGTFLEALNHWLGRLGVTSGITVDLVPKFAYTARLPAVSAPDRPVSLSQVGFGVSQLLPVLMLGLKQPYNGLLLYEQPEIHLHPRLQADLGDFFLSVARRGKTILLETHSDYLVNRLRRRIAEDQTGELARLVNILFVHPGTAERPGSYVEPLEIGPDGSIINCPPDFFSEAADEAYAILRARAAKAQSA